MPAGTGGESLIRTLQDALRANVDPAAGRHLAVHGQPHLLQTAELFPSSPLGHQEAVRDQHPGSQFLRADDANRLAGLNQKRLVVFELAKRGYDLVERLPIAGRLARAAVNHQMVRILSYLRIEIIHEHAQSRLLDPALACSLRAAWRTDQAWTGSFQANNRHNHFSRRGSTASGFSAAIIPL